MRLRSFLAAFFVPMIAIVAALLAIQSDEGRWLLKRGEYTKQVLAQPSSPRRELKHIEWGGWGWAGQDTNVYLVYDPTDKLAEAGKNKPGKFAGIPCDVPSVRALERDWYLVTFYTNTSWNNCDP